MAKKIIVFLRAFPDVDHITPVINKIDKIYQMNIDVILLDKNLRSLYHINFLSKSDDICVYDISEFMSQSESIKRSGISGVRRLGNNPIIRRIGKRLLKSTGKKIWNKFNSESTAEILFPEPENIFNKLMNSREDTIVILDWPKAPTSPVGSFQQSVLHESNKRELQSIILPHGDKGYSTHLVRESLLREYGYNFEGISIKEVHNGESVTTGYNHFICPNELSAEKSEPIDNNSKISILGSPRYNKEWIEINSKISPSYDGAVKNDAFNILFFLQKLSYPIFWEEVYRSIKLIGNLEGVNLVVKGHPRQDYAEIKSYIIDQNNVQIENNEHSVSLLEWSDAVIDLGSSIAFEAIVRDLPVLYPEYMYAPRSTVVSEIKDCEMTSRDEFYVSINKLKDQEKNRIYSESDRREFIDKKINVDSDNVLREYSEFIVNKFKSS